MAVTLPPVAPVLSDGVVSLRAHVPGDVPEMVVMGSDVDTVRWTMVPVPFDRSHADEWATRIAPTAWRDATDALWAIEATDPATGAHRFAGNIDLRLGPPPDLGYALAPWARGHGIMARSIRLVTRYGFEELELPVVHWSAHAGNLTSWRTAHACGFTFDGSRPLSVPQRGALHDGWYASLRPGDPSGPRTTWRAVPTLDDGRVRLRAHTDADVPRIVEACSDERAQHWLTLPRPYTEIRAREFVLGCRLAESLGQTVTWAVTDPSDDRLLANIGIFGLGSRLDPTGSEVGYWTHPDARGRGLIGAALELVLAHAFAPVAEGGLGRHRVQIGTAWSNAASRHVAERAGFTLLGRFRQDGVVGVGDERGVEDSAWYDLLASDRA